MNLFLKEIERKKRFTTIILEDRSDLFKLFVNDEKIYEFYLNCEFNIKVRSKDFSIMKIICIDPFLKMEKEIENDEGIYDVIQMYVKKNRIRFLVK